MPWAGLRGPGYVGFHCSSAILTEPGVLRLCPPPGTCSPKVCLMSMPSSQPSASGKALGRKTGISGRSSTSTASRRYEPHTGLRGATTSWAVLRGLATPTSPPPGPWSWVWGLETQEPELGSLTQAGGCSFSRGGSGAGTPVGTKTWVCLGSLHQRGGSRPPCWSKARAVPAVRRSFWRGR